MPPTIKDIAKMTGVSIGTVSYVLNGKGRVGEEKRRLILETAEKIGYVPNRNARNLVQQVSGKIGLFIPGLDYLRTSTFFNNLMAGVLSVVNNTDIDLLLGLTTDNSQNYAIGNLDVDGAIFLHPVNDDAYYDLLLSKRIPFVVVGRPKEAYASLVTYVDLDNLAISYNGTKMLLEQKHKKILLITGEEALTISADQVAGYRMALSEYGVDYDPSLVLRSDFVMRKQIAGLRERLQEHPDLTGIVTASDTQAISAMTELVSCGLAMPDDMSMVCLSGSGYTSLYQPQITSVMNPNFELGRQAAMKVCDLIRRKALRPSNQIVDYTIFEGDSIAAPRKMALILKTP